MEDTDLREIEQAIDYLNANHQKSLDYPDMKERYEQIERFRNKHKSTNSNVEEENDKILAEIIKRKYRPTNIDIATGGAYLWGCSQNYYGDVNKPCSALCMNSISHDSNHLDNSCQYSIWTYYSNNLERRNNILSSKAYIYVSNDWNGFTASDITFLKSSRIFFATILSTNNSKHKTIIPMTSVDNLPMSKKYTVLDESFENDIGETSYSYYFYFFVIIIGLFLYLKFDKNTIFS